MSIWCARGVGSTPAIVPQSTVHVILRNALDGCEDPYVLRAAEMFFRPQRHDLARRLVDCRRRGNDRRHEREAGIAAGLDARHSREAEIDVMNDDNAASYWEHSDLFHIALDLTAGRRGLAALARVMRALDRATSRRSKSRSSR